MLKWSREAKKMSFERFSITSFDGLKLCSRYYELSPTSPIEIMFHGYRGNAERDLCGGIQRAFAVGHSVLLIDQRSCGWSEGHVITFGVKEHQDCIRWVNFACEAFPGRKLILTGISMGASTVLMASGKTLPDAVVGVIADCGFSSARAIICKTIKDMHLPPKLVYPIIRLGGIIFGRFDTEATPAVEAVKNTTVPVIFLHGDNDAFVPCYMSEQNYAACGSEKRLVIVDGAGHGLAYPADPERYIAELKSFFAFAHEDEKVA
jgi:pimeloyl-ACP methyl ester carboxylesterase